MPRIVIMFAAMVLTLSGCVHPHQFVEVEQTITRPFFTIKEEMSIESVTVLLLENSQDTVRNITSRIVWNVLSPAKDRAIHARSIQYGIAPDGFQEVVPPQRFERGKLYQVDISGTARTHASGDFFFVLDKRDDTALNVHFINDVDSLIDCINEHYTRVRVLAVCRSENWVVQGQENWKNRIEYLLRKR